MTYTSKDGRVLEKNSFRFGDYEVAYALCSDGDVLKNFTDKDQSRLSMLLADTMGHDKELGDDFSRYLDRVQNYGWGTEKDADKEISDLSHNFPRREEGYDTTPWQPVGSLLQLRKDSPEIQVAHGGIDKPIYMDSQGNIERPDLEGHLEFYNRVPHSDSYKRDAEKGDIILLKSDGMNDNIYEFNNIGKDNKDYDIDRLLVDNKEKSASDIVDTITDPNGFGKACLPRDERYDDLSVLVVKKL